MSDNTFEIQYSIRVLQETLGEREGGRAFLIPKYLIIWTTLLYIYYCDATGHYGDHTPLVSFAYCFM